MFHTVWCAVNLLPIDLHINLFYSSPHLLLTPIYFNSDGRIHWSATEQWKSFTHSMLSRRNAHIFTAFKCRHVNSDIQPKRCTSFRYCFGFHLELRQSSLPRFLTHLAALHFTCRCIIIFFLNENEWGGAKTNTVFSECTMPYVVDSYVTYRSA